MVKFVPIRNLTFPYSYVREIKLIWNFKTIKIINITEAHRSFYPRSIYILKNKNRLKYFAEVDDIKIKHWLLKQH